MGDVIQMGRFRKRVAAERKAAQSDANAVRHGRTRDERDRAAAEANREAALLDGARLEPHPDDPADPKP